jgi:hypothetical protein
MNRREFIWCAASAATVSIPGMASPDADRAKDPRNYATGRDIPGKAYICQNYIVVTDDGGWLCVPTVGPAAEGNRAQHIVATISNDRGRSWSSFIDIEPPGPPEASWAMPLKVPGGRVYVFYTYNDKNVSEYRGRKIRADTLGQFVFKYSDDHGRTWSKNRYTIPSRRFAIDRNNFSSGEILLLWGVSKPIITRGSVYFGAAKVGVPSIWSGPNEGIVLRSDNLLREKDPEKIGWDMLPEGDVGLRAPRGNIAEETFVVSLDNGDLYACFRTTDGYLGQATSRDRGRTWADRQYAVYQPGGLRIKNPRGPGTMQRFSNGKYLLHFFNNSGSLNRTDARPTTRNPGWLIGGVERNGTIHWSQPEICVYQESEYLGLSYPDFIEDDGRYYIAPTTKETARIFELDKAMLDGLWNQRQLREVSRKGLLLEVPRAGPEPHRVSCPRLPDLRVGGGFAIDFWVRFSDLAPDQVLFDSRAEASKGVLVYTTAAPSLGIQVCDGLTTAAWDTDLDLFHRDRWHHVALIVDGGPRIISFAVDGILCDGRAERERGWLRFSNNLGDVNGSADLKLAAALRGQMRQIRVYDRYLRTSEAIGNFQAGI